MTNEQRDRLDMVIKKVFARMKNLTPAPEVCSDEETLAAYLTGDLTQEEKEKTEEHLAICSLCTDNLMSLSEAENSQETFATSQMVKRAKNLVRPKKTPPLWKRISLWFPVPRPVPVMAAASFILVVAFFGIYNLYIPSDKGSLPISLSLIARTEIRGTTDDYRELEIKDGGALQSGDMFRIRFELDEGAYVYLLSRDSQGNLSRLFPDKDAGFPPKFIPNKTHIIPEKERWLRLDENTGQETLYLLTSSEIIRGIDQKISQLKRSGIDKIAEIFSGVKIESITFRHE